MAHPTLTERYRAARGDPTLVVLEGVHALKHALRFGADVVDARTRDPAGLRELAQALAPDVAERIASAAGAVDADAFDTLAPSPHPTGVIALAGRPGVALDRVLAAPGPAPLVLLERPTHHGNIGAVVRVAAAAGAAGVLVTGRHDPWHPASIRGGAGLQFALPVAGLTADGVETVLASGRPVVALDPDGVPLVGGGGGRGRGGHDVPAASGTRGPDASPPIPPRAVLVFGSERTGVSEALLGRVDHRVAIPMRPGVSSLNLATAVAVTLYAAGGWTAFAG
ncbi:MAG: TrmH family RNA methyltransferase [Longimicrobiales bacterium]